MYHISKDKRAYSSADKISKAMMECLENKNFTDITVTDIQKISKISRATFYRLFDNTSDVLSYLCDNIFVPSNKEFEQFNTQTADKIILSFIERCMENKTLLTAIVESNRIDFLNKAHNNFFELKQSELFPHLKKEELNYLATILTACTCAFIVSWVQNGCKETAKELHTKLKKCYKTLGKIFE